MQRSRQLCCLAFVFLWGVLRASSSAQDRQPGANPVGKFLNVAGSRIYYEECGTGPAIVLLHDGLLHAIGWDGVWTPLCRTFHVVRYDRRGFGRSDSPKGPFLQTDDLAALLAQASVPRATLVGCSSGSALAIDFAIRQPEKVEELVLIGPVVHGMPSSEHFDERGRKNSAPLENGDIRTAALNWSKDVYQIAGDNAAARRALYEALVNNPQNLRYRGDFEIRFLRPAVSRLSEIHVPVLILVGEHDIPDVHAQSGVIQAGIWGSQRKVIKEAGHLVPLEKPAELATEITRFVTDHRLASVPTKTLETYAGKYKLFGGTGEFVVENGRLILRLPAERDMPVYPLSDSEFFMIIWGEMRFDFVKDASGKVTGVDLFQNGQVQHCARV